MTTGVLALFSPTARDDDLARAWRAVGQMLAIGGDTAWLGAMIAERLGKPPDYRADRLRRRDAAIVSLAQLYQLDGSAKSARALARILRISARSYELTRWRSERGLDAAPAVYGPVGAALHAMLAASGDLGAPKDRTIRAALAAAGLGRTNLARAPKKARIVLQGQSQAGAREP